MKRKLSGTDSEYVDIKREGTTVVLRPLVDVTLSHAQSYARVLQPNILPDDTTALITDLSAVAHYDSFLIVMLAELERLCRQRSAVCRIEGATPDMQRYIDMMIKPLLDESEPRSRSKGFVVDYVESVGERAQMFLNDARFGISFVGNVTLAMLDIVLRPSSIRWKDFPFFFSRGGVNALPIVSLITFLIGVITGYQGAVQLHKFGADIFLADLVTISLTRELAPLMGAIIVAGRSGSAYAAEIGTMKVGEEIDALKSMGFNITKFLIMPRVLATTLSLPLLTIFADLMGIIGGIVAASFILDISLVRFLNQAQQALQYWDIFTGLFKSVLFGAVIGMVGCFRGLQVEGGAESVGKYTTQAVVTSIFLIILLDAIFTVIFQLLGI